MNNSIETRQNMMTGLALIAICAGLFFFTFAYDKQALSRGTVYYASFEDVTGLKPGNPVKLNGVVSGFVESMSVVDNRAQLKFRIWPKIVLYQGANVRLRNKTFLGGRFIELEAGEQNAGRLQNGANLLVMDSPVNPEELLEMFGASLPENGQLIDELSVAYKFGQSMPEKFNKLSGSFKRANKLLSTLGRLKARLKAVKSNLQFDRDFENLPTDFIKGLDGLLVQIDLISKEIGSLQKMEHQAKELYKKLELLAVGIGKLGSLESKILENLDKALIGLLAYDELFLRKLVQTEGIYNLVSKSEINKRIEELEQQ